MKEIFNPIEKQEFDKETLQKVAATLEANAGKLNVIKKAAALGALLKFERGYKEDNEFINAEYAEKICK